MNTEAITLLDKAIAGAEANARWNDEQAANAQGIADKYRAVAKISRAKADNLRDTRNLL